VIRAYSYIRFSSGKQRHGDSLRRQSEAATEYAASHGLILDEALTYRDLGVSGYDSSNVHRGALFVFLTALRDGQIPRGSFLLIEKLDRLTRAQFDDAYNLLKEIVEAGVSIVTLADGRILDAVTIKNYGESMVTFAMLFRAHEESENRSNMIKKAWGRRRKEKPPVFSRSCPMWLKPRKDGSGYDLIPDRVESIQKVFEMMVGGFGANSIVRRANAEQWPAPSKSKVWNTRLIGALVLNRSLIGEFQPHNQLSKKVRQPTIDAPWVDYFPRAIDEALFYGAQAATKSRAQGPRRPDEKHLNIFRGVLKCSCGASFTRQQRARTINEHYKCMARHQGLTECPSINSKLFVKPVLTAVFNAGFVTVTQDDFTAWARDELLAAQASYDDLRARLAKLIAALELAPDVPELADRVRALSADVIAAKAHHAERNTWFQSLVQLQQDPAVIQGNLTEVFAKLKDDEFIEFRAQLHERLKRAIIAVTLYADKLQARIVWRNPQPDTIVTLGDIDG
jgi:DNA invertase Pin-like site-specific DNA recombinase